MSWKRERNTLRSPLGRLCVARVSLKTRSPSCSAIFTKSDGIVDWHVCMTGNPDVDFEVSATHLGLVFNPIVFDVVAHRLAGKNPGGVKSSKQNSNHG